MQALFLALAAAPASFQAAGPTSEGSAKPTSNDKNVDSSTVGCRFSSPLFARCPAATALPGSQISLTGISFWWKFQIASVVFCSVQTFQEPSLNVRYHTPHKKWKRMNLEAFVGAKSWRFKTFWSLAKLQNKTRFQSVWNWLVKDSNINQTSFWNTSKPRQDLAEK